MTRSMLPIASLRLIFLFCGEMMKGKRTKECVLLERRQIPNE